MQDMLSQLDLPIIIGLIVAISLILVVAVLFVRRARARQAPPAEQAPLSEPIDYTSLPLDEEPAGWRERFARLSTAGKILSILVPILALLGILALILTLLPPGEQGAAVPTPEPVTVRVRDAAVIRADPLTINVTIETSGLANGSVVTAELLEDGEPFPWMNPEQTSATVRNNRAELQALRAPDAPTPSADRRYTVVARAPDGTASAPTELIIPSINLIADAFFERSAAAPTSSPAAIATSAPTAAPTAPASTPTAAPTSTPELPTGPAASVSNGGNVRKQPIRLADNVVAGVNAGETVQLLSRTPNGEWYRVRTVRDEIGWVAVSLLRIPADAQVPVAPVVTVFGNGPLYERADATSTELDRVNQGEVVELTGRTAVGDWYAVVNVRDITGWVPANLLGVPAEVAASVPVAE